MGVGVGVQHAVVHPATRPSSSTTLRAASRAFALALFQNMFRVSGFGFRGAAVSAASLETCHCAASRSRSWPEDNALRLGSTLLLLLRRSTVLWRWRLHLAIIGGRVSSFRSSANAPGGTGPSLRRTSMQQVFSLSPFCTRGPRLKASLAQKVLFPIDDSHSRWDSSMSGPKPMLGGHYPMHLGLHALHMLLVSLQVSCR